MNIYKNSLALILILFLGTQMQAQQGDIRFHLNYAAGIPMSGLKPAVNQTSWRGWDASVMYGITDQLSIGLQTGNQDFYQKYPRQNIHQSGSDLSAVITNSIQVMPIMAKVKYSFSNKGIAEPYAALGIGGNLITYNKYYGEFNDNNSSFKFAAQPELGINIPVGVTKKVGFNLSAGYNLMPFQYNEVTNLNNIVIKGGINIRLR